MRSVGCVAAARVTETQTQAFPPRIVEYFPPSGRVSIPSKFFTRLETHGRAMHKHRRAAIDAKIEKGVDHRLEMRIIRGRVAHRRVELETDKSVIQGILRALPPILPPRIERGEAGYLPLVRRFHFLHVVELLREKGITRAFLTGVGHLHIPS